MRRRGLFLYNTRAVKIQVCQRLGMSERWALPRIHEGGSGHLVGRRTAFSGLGTDPCPKWRRGACPTTLMRALGIREIAAVRGRDPRRCCLERARVLLKALFLV